VTALEGKTEETVRLMRESISLLDANDMPFYAAGARYRLGELLGGEEGRLERERGLAWMKERDVVNPEQMVVTLAPAVT
jgi:hypothetical protein